MDENLVLHARDVRFDWSAVPLHWVPGEPLATHAMNTLHLVLPEGERWFVRVFKQALPLIRDEALREDVLGFIGQEAMHAEAHQGAADHLAAQGLDPAPFVAQIEWLFRGLLGDRDLTGVARHQWLLERLSVIAAIEHFTAVLGHWVLTAPLESADPTMLDLLRWHGAEEVEHRAAAYDLYMHLDGRYLRRLRAMLVAGPVLFWLFARSTRWLMAHDPLRPGRARWRDYLRVSRRGLLPALGELLPATWRYLPRSYHPSREGSTELAVAYLAKSPAARAAG
ncbi:metal-dependent hydrolase [Actinokineospora sp. NBRC 105648]|uniref:metal-dependent hydrolase n=1 Tax=Actinokineospora sp. NBRC 105648 TaxID=3032206 RepID=UPI0024A4D6CE|nr:metal-dependent hydrolase [Actinokineospora sp. NBRC 105648]GLZ39867.1 metal-dependent hydrolase [Actinokineospora sp. NBRC 105648]